MAAATKIWATALRQLAELPATRERTSTSEAVDDVVPLPILAHFSALPSIAPAEWHRVVADLKVPLKLGQAATAYGAPDPLAPRTYAAIRAVGVLLRKACSDGAVVLGHSPNSLTRSIGQQLGQSGLLAALPLLLDAVAAALDASAHAPDPADMAQTLCSVVCSIYTEAHTQQEAVARGVLDLVRAHLEADLLLTLLNHCLGIWPHHVDRAAVSVPALRLCAAAFQHCSRCVDALPAAPAAPTALEEVMAAAWATADALCRQLGLQEQGALSPSELHSPDALRTACMLVMVIAVAPRAGGVSGKAAPHSSTTGAASARSSSSRRVRRLRTCGSKASVAASQAAWQAACARESSLSTAQQQALQELGCSGRAFMWVAGHALAPLMGLDSGAGAVIDAVGDMLLHGTAGSPSVRPQDSPTLDQPQHIRQLAGALSQLQPSDSPPCGSPLLPCAALLWLMPAVLLEWAQGQPTDSRELAIMLYSYSNLLEPCLNQTLLQPQFWQQAEALFAEAAATSRRPGGEQALRLAVCCSPSGPEQQPAALTEEQMFLTASKAASRFGACWQPPASCLALLLQLSSSTAACILACMQGEGAGPSNSSSRYSSKGNSSTGNSSKGSSSKGSSSKGNSSIGSSSKDAAHVMGRSAAATGLPPFTASLQGLSTGQYTLLQLCSMCLQKLSNMSSRPAAGCSGDVRAQRAQRGSTSANDSHACDDGDGLGSLASLCAALQQTLPQVAGLVEAAPRCPAGGIWMHSVADTLYKSSMFLHWACSPGPLIAARLQPGSPALKALCGVALTVLKLVGAVVGGGELAGEDSTAAINCLQLVMNSASLVLQAACADTASRGSNAGGSSSSSNLDAVITALLSSGICSDHDAASLSSNSTSAAATGRSPTSPGPGDAVVVVVPWLVAFGRCCLLQAALLQQTEQAVTPDTQDLRHQTIRDVSRVLPGWLQSDGVSAQLSFAGYNTARLLELLQQAPQAQQQECAVDLAQQLQDVGLALTSLPFGTGCNNSRCCALGELSEHQLVVGTARLCSGCRVARYCCRACQVAAWKLHKPACKAMAAARAADNPAVM